MAIRQTKYVDIVSGVGGKAAVSDRELIARVFTKNKLCGYGHVYEFDDADAVMEYFGSTSDEYKFAAKYFGFVSKSISKAKKISFFRWTPNAINPYIMGFSAPETTVAKYTGSNCKLAFKFGEATENDIVNISFSTTAVPTFSATETYAVGDIVQHSVGEVNKYYKCKTAITSGHSFDSSEWDEIEEAEIPWPYALNSINDVCAAITSSLNDIPEFSASSTYAVNDYVKKTSGASATYYKCIVAVTTAGAWNDANWKEAETYFGSSCTISNSKITLSLPASVSSQIKPCIALPVTGAQNDLATILRLTDAVCSNVSSGETPTEAASRSDGISDNYGSFTYLDELEDDEYKGVAEWNATKNYKYLFCIGILGYTDASGMLVNGSAIQSLVEKGTGIGGIVGTCVWCYRSADDYITAFPAALFATTDYTRANTTKTFMYQQNDSIQTAITNDRCANILDPLFVNYMGVTQSAGGLIQFSQDGFNMDGVDTAVYCNEVWMKSRFWTAIMNLFLALEKVPANDVGAGQIKTVMMDTITTAIKNGTIQPHKDFTITQKVYIGTVLDNTEAWKDVWSNGYVLKIVIEPVNNKYVAKYILVYSKGDAVRKVEGSDILI